MGTRFFCFYAGAGGRLLLCRFLINTHRLLVRGVRVETTEIKQIRVSAEATKIDPVIVAICVAVPLVILLFVILSFPRRKDKSN